MSKPFIWTMAIIIGAVTWFSVHVLQEMEKKEVQEQSSLKFKVDLTPEQQKDQTLIATLERMVVACPGLKKYSPDLSRALVQNNYGSYFYNENSGMQITFKVSDAPTSLPSPLNVRSRGHNCFFDIHGAGAKVAIAKSACQSLCTGTWVDRDDDLILSLK